MDYLILLNNKITPAKFNKINKFNLLKELVFNQGSIKYIKDFKENKYSEDNSTIFCQLNKETLQEYLIISIENNNNNKDKMENK